MKSWHDVLWGFFIGLILIWLAIEVVSLKGRVADLERAQSNTVFYLVHSGNGKHLKLEQIK